MLFRGSRKKQQSVLKKQPTVITRLKNTYEVSKKYIVYVAIIVSVVVWYFGDFLGSLRLILFPAAIGSIIGILMDTLFRLDASISPSSKEFSTIQEAIPLINEIIARNKGPINVQIIAATGATTLNTVFPQIISGSTEFNISLYLVNPSSVCAGWFPPHWQQEVQMTSKRIQNEIKGSKVSISLCTYENLPNIHGVMINKEHLFIGFFGWRNYRGMTQLSGAERPHLYFTRINSESEFFFDLFEDWMDNSPHQLVYQYPGTSP